VIIIDRALGRAPCEAVLPGVRGPLSAFLLKHLCRPVHSLPGGSIPACGLDPLGDDDLQLALYLCYELHYRPMAGVDAAWEWEPSLLRFRRSLETIFESAVAAAVGPVVDTGDVEADLHGIVSGGSGRSLSRYLLEHGSLDEFREYAVHRSAYQLKEADPHSWAIPRLTGRAKAALVEIQADEYGRGVEAEMHAVLFGQTMTALALDPTYGAYVDLLPGVTLATNNLVSLFGLHRRLRGALVGHLAVFEMTSVEPMRRYSATLGRLGAPRAARRFYDVHVAADAHHQIVAVADLAAGLADAEPALVPDIVFGAQAIMEIEGRFADHLLSAWTRGRTSLRSPLPRSSD
jgi:hypothetical protein